MVETPRVQLLALLITLHLMSTVVFTLHSPMLTSQYSEKALTRAISLLKVLLAFKPNVGIVV